jgi:tetratricopeptide (TPR) repeat protein
MPMRPGLFLSFAIAVAGASCAATRPVPADVRVPPELLRGSAYTAGGEPPRTRYVVRMTDGQRDWEIQLPEIATAYEVKVPLGGKPGTGLVPDMATLTAADREILEEREAAQRTSGEAPGKGKGGKRGADDDEEDAPKGKSKRVAGGPGKTGQAQMPADKPPAARSSYLLTLAKVKELYRTRHYELALVELVELERQYPDDEHILSMKGSLHDRLGNKNLARDAWQQALTLNPFNLAVLEALQRLGK